MMTFHPLCQCLFIWKVSLDWWKELLPSKNLWLAHVNMLFEPQKHTMVLAAELVAKMSNLSTTPQAPAGLLQVCPSSLHRRSAFFGTCGHLHFFANLPNSKNNCTREYCRWKRWSQCHICRHKFSLKTKWHVDFTLGCINFFMDFHWASMHMVPATLECPALVRVFTDHCFFAWIALRCWIRILIFFKAPL